MYIINTLWLVIPHYSPSSISHWELSLTPNPKHTICIILGFCFYDTLSLITVACMDGGYLVVFGELSSVYTTEENHTQPQYHQPITPNTSSGKGRASWAPPPRMMDWSPVLSRSCRSSSLWTADLGQFNVFVLLLLLPLGDSEWLGYRGVAKIRVELSTSCRTLQ